MLFISILTLCVIFGATDVATEDVPSELGERKCEPAPPPNTPYKIGQRAWTKCIEYQELAYPCVKSPSSGDMVRQNCHHGTADGISLAGKNEFPHAAFLGFGNDLAELKWQCSGSLISDKFILTAAYCVSTRQIGPPTYAALNTLDKAAVSPENIHKILNVFSHPEYQKKYNDIALLELEKPVPLDSSNIPACLFVASEENRESESAVATSLTTRDTQRSGKFIALQKILLSKYTTDECLKVYPGGRTSGPYNETTQLCYGDRTGSKDICYDDGGTGLMVDNKNVQCMYSLVGVTAYGRGCLSTSPGVYVRVEAYVPWIESIVWP